MLPVTDTTLCYTLHKSGSDGQVERGPAIPVASPMDPMYASSASGAVLPLHAPLQHKPPLTAFAARVFGWVAIQLAVTVGACGAVYSAKDQVLPYLTAHPFLIYAPILLLFISLGGMFCSRSTSGRLGWFALFTLAMSLTVAAAVLPASPGAVMLAAGVTCLVVACSSLFAWRATVTGYDLSGCGAALAGPLSLVCLMSFANIFLGLPWLDVGIAAVSVVLFTCYLVYDLARVYAGSDAGDPLYEDGLLAAVEIYLDVINIFLNMLELASAAEGDP